jgi:hypothetical protein
LKHEARTSFHLWQHDLRAVQAEPGLPLLHSLFLFVCVCSFGVMMWELFTGQEAFGKLLYGQFFETIVVNDLRPVSNSSRCSEVASMHVVAAAPAVLRDHCGQQPATGEQQQAATAAAAAAAGAAHAVK